MLIKASSQELITLRVQYLVDADPFTSVSMFPIPTRAPSYSFISTEPLATQLASVLRLLNAPHRVRKTENLINTPPQFQVLLRDHHTVHRWG